MLPDGALLIEKLDHLVGGGALGRPLLLNRVAKMKEADEALVLRDADGHLALAGAQHLGRPPVGGQAAGVPREQNDVGGAAGGVQVLLVLDWVARERAGTDDQRRSAVELLRRLRAGGLLQPFERHRP